MKKLITLSTATLGALSKAGAYTGAGDIITGGTSTNDLSRDIYIETLEAFMRRNVFLALVMKQTIASGNAGQFVIGGKGDGATGVAEYTKGAQIDVSDTPFDERTITLDRPVYTAKRLDQFEEKVAHYDVRGPITRFMGEDLAYKVDTAIADVLYTATQDTGLVGNPDSATDVVVATGTTAQEKGDALAEAIFAASASLQEQDDYGQAYAVVSPESYGYLVQSGNAVNTDFTSGNGGYDSGVVHMVGGVTIVSSNNVKGSLGGTTTATLVGMVFTEQAVGVLELIGLKTSQDVQIDFLDATLMTAYYAMGTGVLRPESAVALVSA